MRQPWHRAAAAVLDYLMPSRCAGCRAPGAPLCRACADEIGQLPAIARQARGGLPPAVALGACSGLLRAAILALKFRRARTIGRFLGNSLATIVPWEVDMVVPVPLHPLRERERGYNQAGEIASGLARIARIPIVVNALVRVRVTAPQTSLDLISRSVNVHGAFASGSGAALIGGRRILLVDDVITTGATALACAEVLRSERASAVYLASAALRL